MKAFWSTLRETMTRHGAAVAVRVVEVAGSAPREAGAWIVVAPDGGYHGTIGGGALEWRAIAAAQRAFGNPQIARLSKQALGPELGQCCGGAVTLLVERFDAARLDEVTGFAARVGPFVTHGRLTDAGVLRRVVEVGLTAGVGRAGDIIECFGEHGRPVLLFGAGHVGRAVVLALAPLAFCVRWIDNRDGAFPAAMPASVTAIRADDPAVELAAAPDEAFVLVMTHSHAVDQAIVHAALAAERFAYIGLIGSATKRARFTKRLEEAGIAADRIADHLVCPIGLPAIRSKHPAAIAAGIAADLLVRNEAAAKRMARTDERLTAMVGE